MSNLGNALHDDAERAANRLRAAIRDEWVGYVADWHLDNRDPQPDGRPWPCGCDNNTADDALCEPSLAYADNRLRRWLFDSQRGTLPESLEAL